MRKRGRRRGCGHLEEGTVSFPTTAERKVGEGRQKEDSQIGPLARLDIHVRQKGAEHGMLGTTFDYRQNQVLDLYRMERRSGDLSTRCLRCTTDDALGLKRSTGRGKRHDSLPCIECIQRETDRKEELRRAAFEEEQRQKEEAARISKERAKRSRDSIARMFRPKHLEPLGHTQSLLTMKPEDHSDSDSDSDSVGALLKEEALFLPPPKQLESLLQVSIRTKEEYIRVVKAYKKHRRKLARLQRKAEEDRKMKEQIKRQEQAQAERQQRYEALMGRSLKRIRNQTLCSAFETWRDNAAFSRKFRWLTRMCLEHSVAHAWDAWRRFIRDWKIEKEVAAVVVQAYVRRHLAYSAAAQRRVVFRSILCIQRFGRFVLARNITRVLKRKLQHQQSLVQRSLMRLSGNLMLRTFQAWKKHLQTIKKVEWMWRQSKQGLLQSCFKAWRIISSRARKERTSAAVLNIQRIGRGFLGKRELVKRRLQWKSAIVIQQMVRNRLARNMLRHKLWQRRIVRRKLKKCLGEELKSRFRAWKSTVKQIKMLRRMIQGSRMKVVRYFFSKWTSRRHAVVDLQRMVRGFLARKRVFHLQIEALAELSAMGYQSLAEKERMQALMDSTYQSPLLSRLRQDLIKVKRLFIIKKRREELQEKRGQANMSKESALRRRRKTVFRSTGDDESVIAESDDESNDKILRVFRKAELDHPDLIVMSIHGTSQQFSLSKHAGFLIEVLAKDIEREIDFLHRNGQAFQELLKREREEWVSRLSNFLGEGRHDFIKDFKTYYRAGKSFSIRIQTPKEANETIQQWKHMFSLEYISRWTLVAWVAEGLLLRNEVRLSELETVWDSIQTHLDRFLQEDIAAYVLQRIANDQQNAKR